MNLILASILIGLGIPATSAVIATVDTVVRKKTGKNYCTPTIITGKIQDYSDRNANIPNQVLPYLEITNSPFQPSSKHTANTLSKKLKKEFPTSDINTNPNSSSNTLPNSNKEKSITSEISEKE